MPNITITKLVVYAEELIKGDFILGLGRVEQVRYFFTAVANQFFIGQELFVRPKSRIEAESIIAREIDKVYCLKFGQEESLLPEEPKKVFGSVYVVFSTGKKRTFACGTDLEIKRTEVLFDDSDDYYSEEEYA